jgi:DNA-binding NtrC family response regulator
VVTAGRICDAIGSLVPEGFNLVLLDLKMPDKNGLELLSNLHDVYPRLPVIVKTAFSATDFANNAECLGTRGYFLKPVDPAELLDCIKEILPEPEASKN